MADRPLLTFDLDGVLVRPPFGINPGRGRNRRRDATGRRNLLWLTERWRYHRRSPMPGAREGLEMLTQRFDCGVLSARGDGAADLTRRWLEKQLGVRPAVYLRRDWHETPAAFKARMVTELGALAHFEDDPHTAAWLAELIPAVFLVDWPRNRWLRAARVHRITQLEQSLPVLEGLLADMGEG